ncbi:hypothetical protein ABT160_05930 [Streptomyces sp. NPDC001941]|uniref:hypothetical protein n=1 Tax=Streptomyces sp. NPDC001941 TaxID=3154659 RepID=UPI0033289972
MGSKERGPGRHYECRGCGQPLYATHTHQEDSPVRDWEIDHQHPPSACPLERLLPLTGSADQAVHLPQAPHLLLPLPH